MSTRACYVFKDSDQSIAVYKHHDGYPSGAVQFIAAAQAHAWKLPRFEADEFAAAFVAANKPSNAQKCAAEMARADEIEKTDPSAAEKIREWAREYLPGGRYADTVGGGVRLMQSSDVATFPWDLAFIYVVECIKGNIRVQAHHARVVGDNVTLGKRVFSGTLAAMAAKFPEDC